MSELYTIKPLEWRTRFNRKLKASSYFAGPYHIIKELSLHYGCRVYFNGSAIDKGQRKTFAQTKAVAQSHYEKTLKQCLEIS